MAKELKKVSECIWEIEPVGKMRVPARIYADEHILEDIKEDESIRQACNVATLPGIVKYSLAMPDIHSGYGFPIGGVAAFDYNDGVLSPGGVGYDINCGVRVAKTNLELKDVEGKVKKIVDSIFANVPSGLGSSGAIPKQNVKELKEIMIKGAKWAIEKGYGEGEDLEYCEERGQISGADPEAVSQKAIERGLDQVGTVGSGNHFVEIDFIDEIYDERLASMLGIKKNQILIQLHSGSRGFGYQICDDFIRVMRSAAAKYKIELADMQLACAPIQSPEGKRYFAAMACAANYAWANRQTIMYLTGEAIRKALELSKRDFGLSLIYDVAHNIAKIEEHNVDGVKRKVCVHRKGATRAFGPNNPVLPAKYRKTGQPVLIPGDMGTHSYILVGNEKAMNETFGSTCHGAGRLLSRTAAKKTAAGRNIVKELEDKGIIVRSDSKATLLEEIPEAYKDVSIVVDVVHKAGLATKVARLKPLGVAKG
jgi:tRNA-splicing ligase RtcB